MTTKDQIKAALLPCPFCGGRADIRKIGNEHHKNAAYEKLLKAAHNERSIGGGE